MTEENIPLTRDPKDIDPSGVNPKDKTEGNIAIEGTPGNDDATVALPGFVDTPEHVEEGDKLEDQFNTTTKGE